MLRTQSVMLIQVFVKRVISCRVPSRRSHSAKRFWLRSNGKQQPRAFAIAFWVVLGLREINFGGWWRNQACYIESGDDCWTFFLFEGWARFTCTGKATAFETARKTPKTELKSEIAKTEATEKIYEGIVVIDDEYSYGIRPSSGESGVEVEPSFRSSTARVSRDARPSISQLCNEAL